jgi:bacterioferritin
VNFINLFGINDEELHFEGFENEFENLEKFGDNYLAQQAMERSKKSTVPNIG